MRPSFLKPKFRLRTLLLVLTLIAVALGMTANWVHRRQAAVAHLRRVAFSVDTYFDSRLNNESMKGVLIPGYSPQRIERTWRERFLGDRWSGIYFEPGSLSAETVDAIATLPEIRYLRLSGTNVNDDDIRQLRGLRRLEYLELSGCPITDAATETLAEFQNLRWLELNGTPITDEAAQNLKRLTQLETLRVRDTLLTDRGIMELGCLTNLKDLHCGGDRSDVTTAALRHIKRCLPDCGTAGSYRIAKGAPIEDEPGEEEPFPFVEETKSRN